MKDGSSCAPPSIGYKCQAATPITATSSEAAMRLRPGRRWVDRLAAFDGLRLILDLLK
jgi:hypothetical protein